MPESRINEVARELLGQSKEDKVDWESTGIRGSYRVIFPDVALTIYRVYLDYEETSDLLLELMNETGRVIDPLEAAPEHSMHCVLAQIFDLAERHVRDAGIDKALEYLKRS
jgi:hypothetical protein